ncbi:MAG: hypothetical protein F4X03_10535, partial [Dehalococcoidia bacterium]|nr:hypothetical protein [Dehalococcoidia bacterium]
PPPPTFFFTPLPLPTTCALCGGGRFFSISDTSSPELWAPALDESAAALQERLQGTPDEWLQRRVPLIEGDGSLAGWRVLMMLVEHEVHHRSQIDTYAGLNGWSPPDIFGMSAEGLADREDAQRRRLAERGG